MLAAVLVALIITAAYKGPILNAPTTTHVANVDPLWRLLIGLGCIPGVIALYFRLTIPETPRFTMDIERNIQQATSDIKNVIANEPRDEDELAAQRVDAPKASWADFRRYFGQWKNGKILLGTSWSWFALDIAFYGLGLNSSIILEAIGFGTPVDKTTRGIYENLLNVTKGNLIFSAAGLIPGYWASFLVIDSWGRKPIQLMGFSVLTVLFVIMGK